MTTARTDSGASRAVDPVDSAIEALAAPRWSGTPDWRSFQEQIMSHRTFGWRRFSLLSLVVGGCFAAGAVAGAAWERFSFTSTMQLNSGGTAQVSGEFIQLGDGTYEVNADTGGVDISSGGSMQVALPDGAEATIVVEPSDGKQTGTTQPEPSSGGN